MSDYNNPHYASSPTPLHHASPQKRASLILWITNAIILFIYGSCGCFLTILSFAPFEQIIADSPDITAEQADQLYKIHPILPYFAAFIILIFFLPAFANLIFAFLVRKSSKPAIITCIILSSIQILFFGLNLFASLASLNPLAMFFALIINLPFIAFFIYAIKNLAAALYNTHPSSSTYTNPSPNSSPSSDPWNDHLK